MRGPVSISTSTFLFYKLILFFLILLRKNRYYHNLHLSRLLPEDNLELNTYQLVLTSVFFLNSGSSFPSSKELAGKYWAKSNGKLLTPSMRCYHYKTVISFANFSNILWSYSFSYCSAFSMTCIVHY